jgi:hypothetical protein
MLAVAFDTLKLARKLESAGMAPKQAQDTSAALSETFTEWLSVGSIATREDVQKLEAKIASLDTKISETKFQILQWMFIAVGAQTFVILGAIFGAVFEVVHTLAPH